MASRTADAARRPRASARSDPYDVDVAYVNAAEGVPYRVRLLDFDGVVLHTTFLCARWYDDYPAYARSVRWIRNLKCPKLAVPQDEYDHSLVLEQWLDELGITHVYSNFDPPRRSILYPNLERKTTFVEVLTGYLDDGLAAYCAPRARPLVERPLDVVYRAQQLPFWFGSHGQLKHRIGEVVAGKAPEHGLKVDISTDPKDTILGDAWADFLMSGRTVIGTESGSSVLDSTGEIQTRIRALVAANPKVTFAEVDAEMPLGWDGYAFFAISPRHLEAVIARSCQLLVRGTYSGVLQPDRHYLPIDPSLDDLDEVLERLRDLPHLQEIADRAYEDVMNNGACHMERFAHKLLEAVPRERRHSVRRRLSPTILAATQAFDAIPRPALPARRWRRTHGSACRPCDHSLHSAWPRHRPWSPALRCSAAWLAPRCADASGLRKYAHSCVTSFGYHCS